MIDYNKIGFKCGLEIHQQLEGKKLFCSCPTVIRKGKEEYSFSRDLRVSLSEMGTVDKAAEHEQSKAKRFVYKGYHDVSCLVEQDEEPPHPVNQEALKTAVQVCVLLNAEVVDQVQFMRKIVIDGSNVSGFQRTALVGMDGYVEVDGKRISIPLICLEEEACQVIERTADQDVYNLSRLGIPLIEIGTGPDIETPKLAQTVAAKLGMILRSTGRCRRGIGSIRQDVNISIAGGSRTEIKGFQDLKSIPTVVDNEITRQQSVMKQGKKILSQVRKAEPDFSTSFLRPMPGADRMYPETDLPAITLAHIQIDSVELLDEKITRLVDAYHVPEELVRILVKKNVAFEDYVKQFKKIKPLFIAEYFVSIPKEVRKRCGVDIDPETYSAEILGKIQSGEISKESVVDILGKRGKGEKVDYSRYSRASSADIEKIIKSVIAKHTGAPIGALMGEAMKELRGKADGKTVMELLKKHGS